MPSPRNCFRFEAVSRLWNLNWTLSVYLGNGAFAQIFPFVHKFLTLIVSLNQPYANRVTEVRKYLASALLPISKLHPCCLDAIDNFYAKISFESLMHKTTHINNKQGKNEELERKKTYIHYTSKIHIPYHFYHTTAGVYSYSFFNESFSLVKHYNQSAGTVKQIKC